MVDLNYIRDNKASLQKAITDKKLDLDLDILLDLDGQRRELLGQVEELRRQQNELSNNFKTSESKDDAIAEIKEKGTQLKQQLEQLEPQLEEVGKKLLPLLVKVPTIPSEDTPIGNSEDDNVEVFTWGEKPQFDFQPKDHIQLAKDLDIIDFERGAKVAGYRGYYLKNEGAQLVMALMMYAFQKMVQAGFSPMIPPTLVKEFALFGSGYFKGAEYDSDNDEIYQIASREKDEQGNYSGEKKFLVGTAEPSLLAYYAGETLEESQLPIKLTGFSQCYRSEIGSYGKDTKGIYRVHEFFKVEQVILCPADPKLAEKLQEEMLELSQGLHQEMGLPYRKLQICTGDLSTGKYRQFDLEAWCPGMNRWAETGSASIFLDWQSRRLNVRYKDDQGNKQFVYMLNNTALPSPRVLIAILENFQQADGSVKIPEVLVPYCGFSEIRPKS